jgi:hypothetical protein
LSAFYRKYGAGPFTVSNHIELKGVTRSRHQ